MSTENAAIAPPVQPRPQSPVRRALPWVAVLLLFVLLGMEFTAVNAHAEAVKEVIRVVGPPDEAAARAITSAKVQEVLHGKAPSKIEDVSDRRLDNGSSKVEVYRWFSINPLVKRELYVYYGKGNDPKVICASADEDAQSSGGAFRR